MNELLKFGYAVWALSPMIYRGCVGIVVLDEDDGFARVYETQTDEEGREVMTGKVFVVPDGAELVFIEAPRRDDVEQPTPQPAVVHHIRSAYLQMRGIIQGALGRGEGQVLYQGGGEAA